MKKIIYKVGNGISILSPTGELSVIETAKKDVPFGLPYLLIDEEDLPSDRTFRNAWTANFDNPDGYGLGPQRWFIEKAQEQIYFIQNLEITEDVLISKKREKILTECRNLIEQMKHEVFQLEGVQI